MNRIKTKFQQLKKLGEAALVGFVTAGDPDPDKSLEIVKSMCESGLDILELGIPFSDPTADGPVIQRSSTRSLAAGTTLPKVLKMTKEVRKTTDIPIILFSYYNPIFAYGVERFYNDAVNAGADGVLIVDLPPEESDELTQYFLNDDFSLIRLIAPTTSKQRIKYITDSATGFVYLVSKTGVTGSNGLNTTSIEEIASELCSLSKIPVCVGFGISTNDDVAAISKYSDGVVIGSAFERTIETNIDNAELVSLISSQVKGYKNATKK